MIRITADVDDLNVKLMLKRIVKAIDLYEFSIHKLIIRKSNSKGYHIIIFTDTDLKKYEIFLIREALGDDKKRIAMDLKRKSPKQYLFYKKISLK